jgi:3-phenylpropionate/trans-cinnamate dioxygenase ferredoxin subunit
MTQWIDAVALGEFGPGSTLVVDTPAARIALFNLNGELHAIEDVCTHDGSPLLGGGMNGADLLDGDQVICPRHGARFCIRSGAALTPPAYEAVNRYPVRVENGMVQIGNEPLPAAG